MIHKLQRLLLVFSSVAVFLSLLAPSGAQQIDWGSVIYSQLEDSNGATLDDTFVFQLGAFDTGYDPNANPFDDWLANWQVFDEADYNGIESPVDDGIYGYFTSTVNMLPDGTSDSPELSPGATSFEGRQAYLWIRNSDIPEEGTEWLLVTADPWVFPPADPVCCGGSLPLRWSTSDLTSSNVPLWGSQGGTQGSGVYTTTGSQTLQTYTFIPEPSVALLTGLGLTLLVTRRRRVE